MRGFVVRELAHPSKISLSYNVPEPTPGPEDVIIDVYSAALNFFDILQTQGKYQVKPPLPFVLGSELAGKIASNSPIPKGCPFTPGDRVFGYGQGAYSDKVSAGWRSLIPLPDNMTYDQGSSLFLTWPTSYEALVGRAELKAGRMGTCDSICRRRRYRCRPTCQRYNIKPTARQSKYVSNILQLLVRKVIAAAGSEEKLDVSQRLGGADYGVNYSKTGWQQEVLKITGGKGVDVIYDPVGMIKDSLKCIAWKGRAVVVGFAGGEIEKLPLNLVLLKNIAVVGIHWGAYTKNEPGHVPEVWKALLELFSSGRVKPVLYTEVFPLDKIPKA
ncbi:hypothetical protein QCA50_009608 [Cerrena zonata]|uniref:Enoyl reductase (ER) domain-containing protein n=1 Tax=Cerrena zonata TaxID=2478898 RepID=A0AAW0G6K6_9APHY